MKTTEGTLAETQELYGKSGTPRKTEPNSPCNGSNGLTVREYFAGLAMQNLQNVLLRKSGENLMADFKRALPGMSSYEVISWCAVQQADALIEALNRW